MPMVANSHKHKPTHLLTLLPLALGPETALLVGTRSHLYQLVRGEDANLSATASTSLHGRRRRSRVALGPAPRIGVALTKSELRLARY